MNRRLQRLIAPGILLLFPAAATGEDLVSLNRAAAEAFTRRDFASAESLSAAAWAACSTSEDRRQAGIAAANVGAAHGIHGRLEEARKWQARAAELLAEDEALAARLNVARALTAYLDSRQYGNAEPVDAFGFLAEARVAAPREAEACELEMMSHSNDGERVQAAYVAMVGEIRDAEEAGDSLRIAVGALRLGCVEGHTGGHKAASGLFLRARAIFETERRSGLACVALRNAGVAAWRSRGLEVAGQRLDAALASAVASGDVNMEAVILSDLSMLAADQDAEEEAVALDRRAAEALGRLIAQLGSGERRDDVLTDFLLAYKLRYIGKPVYLSETFDGFLEYLALPTEGI